MNAKPYLPGLLSLVIPGLGQVYGGNISIGAVWFILLTGLYSLAAMAFAFFLPFVIISHIVCVLHACLISRQ